MQAELHIHTHPLSRVESAKAWFHALPLANPQAAMEAVNRALSALLASDYAGAGASVTFQVLEALYEPMAALSQDLSSRYAGRPLPLSEPQRAAFDGNITLAWTLAYVYHSLIEPAVRGDRDLAKRAALIHQRALGWTAHGMEDHLRASQVFAAVDWDLAQSVLQSADRRKLLQVKVRDPLSPSGNSSVAATYARLLLLHLAGARSLSTREFESARELAHGLEAEVDLSYVVADSHGAGSAAPHGEEDARVVQAGELVHFLGTAGLSRQLQARQERLVQGKLFDSPPLTSPPPLPALRVLLAKLHTAWCSPANQRQAPRSRSDSTVYAAFEPAAVYALMKRRAYVAPAPAKIYSHHEVANIHLRRGDGLHGNAATQETWNQIKPQLEVWQAQDQSATGMRLARVRGNARLRQGQLIALRQGDGGAALLAVVRWAAQSRPLESDSGGETGEAANSGQNLVEIGIHLLPGLARAGAVRHIGTRALAQASAGKTPSSPAVVLDEFSAAPGAEDTAEAVTHAGAPRYSNLATVLLPNGWAREGEEIEFIDGPLTLKLRLGLIAQRLGDIERVRFEVVG